MKSTPPRYLREVCLPRLREGAAQRDRDFTDFKFMLGALVATGPDTRTVETERAKQRQLLAFLYSTPADWPSLALFGWEERGQQLLDLTRKSDWSGMAQVIDDEMLEQFVPTAPYDEIANLLRERYENLATCINFPMPENPTHDAMAARVIAQLQGR